MNNPFWPSVDDLWGAKKACTQASSVAFLVSAVTGALAFLHLRGVSLLESISGANFIDAALFLVLAFFVYRCSRIASLAAFVLYAYGQVLMVQQTHRTPITGILFGLLLIGGIRGAFAFHEMKKGLSREDLRATLKTQREESEPKPSLAKRIAGVTILVLLAGGFYFWYRSAQRPEGRLMIRDARQTSQPLAGTPAAAGKTQGRAPATSNQAPEKSLPSSPGEPKTFRLKNGGSISGRVVKEDPVYYTVEVAGGRQEIVFKEDLQSPAE